MNPSLEHTVTEIAQSFGWAIGQIHHDNPERDLYCPAWENGELRTQEIIDCANLLLAAGVDWSEVDWLLVTENIGTMLAEVFHGTRPHPSRFRLVNQALDQSPTLN